MRPIVQRPRLQRNRQDISIAPRPIRTHAVIVHPSSPVTVKPVRRFVPPAWVDYALDPHVDYRRVLTAEGGIAITYKNIDARFRHTLRRIFLWSCATGAEAWFLSQHSSITSLWINIACLIAVAIINWLIVKRPVEIYGVIEIRPDCMILNGHQIFWRRYIENGWPSFHPDAEGNQQLSGIYGTRQVDYLAVRRCDPLDRTPEVLAAHLQDAMRQLWVWRP